MADQNKIKESVENVYEDGGFDQIDPTDVLDRERFKETIKSAIKHGYEQGCDDTDNSEKLFELEQKNTELNGEVSELKEQNENMEAMVDPDHYGNGNDYDIKMAIAYDLVNNCTERELEALEMLMRIKKGREYRESRIALTHPHHIDLSLCFLDLEVCTSKKNNQWGRFQIHKPS